MKIKQRRQSFVYYEGHVASRMNSGQKLGIPALSRLEMALYWLLSLGSHLYSFSELHRFSTEYEGRLEREFDLEKGFLFWGFKKDPTDFEWSFFSEWGRKSLLWSLLGHAAVSRLTHTFIPQHKPTALAAYGFLAACHQLGVRGVAWVMLHVGVAFGVARLRRPVLCWLCVLLLLGSLHVGPLERLQRSWYASEMEYYLLLFSLAVCNLRSISYSLDHCWRPLEAGSGTNLYWLAVYTFYHPLFYNGPIVRFEDFILQMQLSLTSTRKLGIRSLLAGTGRILGWWLLAESMIHLMYMHAIQSHETYLEILPLWALGGLGLALVQFFYVKYLVLFGVPALLAQLDGLQPPRLPRCVSTMYSFAGMWRHFDVGLYHFLMRYIYIPLGGSRHGALRTMVSAALSFAFVCYWHGGYAYLRCWALMNWLGLMVESVLAALLRSQPLQTLIEVRLSAATGRRARAFLSAFSTAMLILSNLVFLGGDHVGRIFWKRIFIQGWSTAVPLVIGFLYCFAQVGLDWDSKLSRVDITATTQ